MIAVSGSASGIGAAVRRRLEGAGRRVIGVDLRDAEVVADLATPPGREAAVAAVARETGGRLEGLVACAGVGPQVADASLLVRLNYFGAVALLDGLRPALAAARGAAVAVSSNSALLPTGDPGVAESCLAGDEAAAVAHAATVVPPAAYGGGKLALARWVRRHAPQPGWIGAGVRLNAVAPGAVQTPLLQAGLDDPILGPAIRGFPIPAGGPAAPEQIAATIAFLLSPDAAFCCGTLLLVDGGTDALLQPDRV